GSGSHSASHGQETPAPQEPRRTLRGVAPAASPAANHTRSTNGDAASPPPHGEAASSHALRLLRPAGPPPVPDAHKASPGRDRIPATAASRPALVSRFLLPPW